MVNGAVKNTKNLIKVDKDYDTILKTICKKASKLDEKEMWHFFQAFFTPSELEDFCNRYLIVKNLVEGKSQHETAKNVGVSLMKVGAGVKELKYKHGKHIFVFFFLEK